MRIVAILASALALATPVFAKQPLHENPTVISSFYSIGLADEVRKNCTRSQAAHPLSDSFDILRSINETRVSVLGLEPSTSMRH